MKPNKNFPKNIEETIGFLEIRSILQSLCKGKPGKQEVETLCFNSQIDLIEKKLNQVIEYLKLMDEEDPLQLVDILDLSSILENIETKGFVLGEENIWDIFSTIQSGQRLVDFFALPNDSKELVSLTEHLIIPEALLKEIEKTFDHEGKIKWNANKILAQINQKIGRLEKANQSKIVDVFENVKSKGWAGSNNVTIKEGRLMIPILSEHKRKIKGFVYDESANGKISYIEPIEAIETNNALREAMLNRKREIQKILRAISLHIHSEKTNIQTIAKYIAKLDLIRAKALLAKKLGGQKPKVLQNHSIDFIDLYHPLLLLKNIEDEKETIPMDIQLHEDRRMVMISGPNAGGKSVALKNLALNQYMLQCGVLPICHPNSKTSIFRHFFVDIGDHQSIENDLSSYSSHLKYMKYFMENTQENSLIFIDEMGTGTDPSFGGPMAESILQKLLHSRCRGMVTTHYSNMKECAENQKGIINASMAFDVENLRPLYHLVIGQMGSSFAFEVAQRIGFEKQVIENAKGKMNQKTRNIELLLMDLEKEKTKYQALKHDLDTQQQEVNQLKSEYRKMVDELKIAEKNMLRNAQAKAIQVIEEANKDVERTIREIKESNAEKKKTENQKSKLRKKKISLEKQVLEANKRELPSFGIGETVSFGDSDTPGEIIHIKKDKATLMIGQLKTIVPLMQLRKVNSIQFPKVKKIIPKLNYLEAQKAFKQELDIRGMRGESAMKELELWIDEALVLGFGHLRIIHGKGDGILKKLLRERLKNIPHIKSIAYEHPDFGGEGVSLIELK